MRRIFAGSAAVVSMLATSAFAADLAPKMYAKPPVVQVVIYDWNGFYMGGNVGYSWGRERTDGDLTGTSSVSVFRTAGPTLLAGFPVVTTLPTLPLTGRANVNGVIGGGQAGYNWQRGTWLFGLEADFQGSDEHRSADVCTIAGCPLGSAVFTANYQLDWLCTARARVRFLPTERGLLYATAGLAYGHFAATAPLIPLSWGSTRAGGTVGAGVEASIDPNSSATLADLFMVLRHIWR